MRFRPAARRALTLGLSVALASVALTATAQASQVFLDETGGVFIGDASDEINELEVKLSADGTHYELLDRLASLSSSSLSCDAMAGPGEVMRCAANGTDRATVNSGNGDDVITIVGALSSELSGEGGDDNVQGGDGADFIYGNGGNDVLLGGGGNDQIGRVIDTGGGSDTLDGQAGADTMNGGQGPDVMRDSGTSATEVDVVEYFIEHQRDSTSGVTVTLDNQSNDGNDVDATADNVSFGIEGVRGSTRGDNLVGNSRANLLNGGQGDDKLTGAEGADTLIGGHGEDELFARDGEADAVIDCDDATVSDPYQDFAQIDGGGVDPEPKRCESIDRGGSGGGGGAGVPSLKTEVTTSLKRKTYTCRPGDWNHSPKFAYSWFVVPAQGVGAGKVTGRGEKFVPGEDEEGRFIFCQVVGKNGAGSSTARSALALTRPSTKMPNLRGKSEARARGILLDLTEGLIELRSSGKGKDGIPCQYGGTKESKADCKFPKSRGTIDPGDVWTSSPTAGRPLAGKVVKGKYVVPAVSLKVYDTAKDVKLPKVPDKPKVYGDTCPLGGAFSAAEQDSFVNSVLGKYEVYARTLIVSKECRFEVKYRNSPGQEVDPFVDDVQAAQVGGVRGLKLRVSRPKFPDLVVVPYHRRLSGRDSFSGAELESGPINPGIDSGGRMTTLRREPNDVCFHVREASTGDPVRGVVVRAMDPNGKPVMTPDRALSEVAGGGTDSAGNRCDQWRIDEKGFYSFSFVYRGDNGVNEEGNLRIKAEEPDGKGFDLISGRRVVCNKVDCTQTGFGTSNRRAQSSLVLETVVLVTVVAALTKAIVDANAKGADLPAARAAQSSLARDSADLALFKVQRHNGLTPGFVTLGGTLDPSASAAARKAGPMFVSLDGGSLIGQDNAGIISDKGAGILSDNGLGMVPSPGGNLVTVGGAIISDNGGGIVSNDGATIVGDAGAGVIGQDGAGLLGQDGAGLTNRPGGSVIQMNDKSVIVGSNLQLPAGQIVSGGAGTLIPVTPIVSGGAGNRAAAASSGPRADPALQCPSVTTSNGGTARYLNTYRMRCETAMKIARKARGRRYSAIDGKYTCRPKQSDGVSGLSYFCRNAGSTRTLGFLYYA